MLWYFILYKNVTILTVRFNGQDSIIRRHNGIEQLHILRDQVDMIADEMLSATFRSCVLYKYSCSMNNLYVRIVNFLQNHAIHQCDL